MKVSFDLDGTLFGVNYRRLVQIYNSLHDTGAEIGILTGRTPAMRASSMSILNQIGIQGWNFWYDAEYMNAEEASLIPVRTYVAPDEREGIHRFKVRMIEEKEISRHYDDEVRWMIQYAPESPLVDVTKWGGDVDENIIGD